MIGVNLPPAGFVVPHRPGDRGVEQGIGHEVESVSDCLQMLPNLFAERVAPGRDVVEFLQHRKVLVGLDVAHHARIAIPVPGATDATGGFDDPDPLDTGFAQVSAGEDTGVAAADDDHVGVVADRVPVCIRGEGVGAITGDEFVVGQVADGCAPGNETLVALGEVLGVYDLRIEGH